jgi:hypothetical protein
VHAAALLFCGSFEIGLIQEFKMTLPSQFIALSALCLLPMATLADGLASPTDAIVLTISGAIAVTNSAETATFDIGLLQTLPQTTYQTTTIWTEGPQEFTGVLLSDLIEAVGGSAASVQAAAINDYAVEIPGSDVTQDGALVAYLLNGSPMSVRDKGPLWIVYPYDTNPEYQSEVTYSRSIWQLDRLFLRQ